MFSKSMKRFIVAFLIVRAGFACGVNIFEAVEKGDVEHVARMLQENPASVSARQVGGGQTPLHRAVQHGQVSVAELLLNKGADVNVKDDGDTSPLQQAVLCRRPQMIYLLLDNGADMEAQGERPTALGLAAQYGFFDMVKLLVSLGAEVNQRHALSKAPLHFAAEYGYHTIVVFLVQHGADVNACGQYRNPLAFFPYCWASVLEKAIEAAHFEIARFLIRHGAGVDTSTERTIRKIKSDYDWRADKAAFQQESIEAIMDTFAFPEVLARLVLEMEGVIGVPESETEFRG